MSKLLVVDDEERIRSIIRKYGEFEGHEIDEAGDGMEAIRICQNHTYDLIIMDIMMPNLDGFSACKEIRKITDIPVIMLSARGEEYDRIHGFELGIDDYVVKPFSPKELMMRVSAILNRYHKDQNTNREVYEQAGLKIDFTGRKVFIHQKEIDLSPKEYELLLYFIKNKGIAISREQVLSKVWDENYFGSDRVVDDTLRRLRKKMPDLNIKTIYGFGYRLD